MGTIFFSPGCRVNLTAMAPPTFSLALTHGSIAVRKRAIFGERSPNGFAVAVGEKFGLVGNFHARRFQRGDGKFAVPFVYDAVGPTAIKDDAFHGSGCEYELPCENDFDFPD